QDGRDVRVPDHQLLAGLDPLAVRNHHRGAVRNLVLLFFAPLRIDNGDLAVALEGHEAGVAFGVLHRDGVDVAVLDGAFGAGLDIVLDVRRRCDAARVERAHRELRTRLANGLSGDDADRQA